MPTHFSFKPGCAIHPFHGAVADEYIIETADGRRFKLPGKALRILEQLEDGSSLEDICAKSENMNCDDLRSFILANYGDFLVSLSGESFPTRSSPSIPRAKKSLLFSWTIVPRCLTAAISSRLSFCYTKTIAALLVVAILAAHAVLYLSSGLTPARPGDVHVSIILILCIASILAHEFGHAAALARYGGSPNSIGFGLYILLPVFYADVSQVWKLRQWQRVVVDLGGVYFQQIFFALTALAALILRNPSFRAVCVAIDVMTFIALNPALRFDGYWVLTDWLGLSNLHRSAILYLRSLGASLARMKPFSSDRPKYLSQVKTAIFICYALASNIFLGVLIAFNFQWIYSVARGLWIGLPALGREFVSALLARNFVRSTDLMIALLFLFASGTTLFIGIFFQGGALLRILRQKLGRDSGAHSRSLGAEI